jgi:hypothetical protein
MDINYLGALKISLGRKEGQNEKDEHKKVADFNYGYFIGGVAN